MKLFTKTNALFKCLSLCALGALVGTTSCRTHHSLPYTSTKSDPYVQTKDGKKFEGTSAQRSNGLFVKDKIVLGDTSFKTKDVAFYSTGSAVFANVGRKQMAQQVADGKINLYRYMYTTTSTSTSYGGAGGGFGGAGFSHTSSQNHIRYYIQPEPGKPVELLNYRNLASMVQPQTPEFKMLEKYRKTRIVSRSMGYGALGLMVGGAFLATSNSSSTSNLGAAMAGVGFVALWGWVGVYVSNTPRLLRTVLIADKSDKKGSHKRVE